MDLSWSTLGGAVIFNTPFHSWNEEVDMTCNMRPLLQMVLRGDTNIPESDRQPRKIELKLGLCFGCLVRINRNVQDSLLLLTTRQNQGIRPF